MALVYNCCFWFSLRLGGIIIAMFSILQGLAVLISCCVGVSQEQKVKESTAALIDSLNLIYMKPYIDNLYTDPHKYLLLGISFSCVYIIICLVYAYGAYRLNNILMIGYILLEFLRLISLTVLLTTGLLVLKENTMDIGIHIGTSVVGSFLLLGMFYLWICAANLPILINEMERDQQNAIIDKLQRMLDANNTASIQGLRNTGMAPLGMDLINRTPVFLTNKFQRNKYSKETFVKHQRPIYSHFNQ